MATWRYGEYFHRQQTYGVFDVLGPTIEFLTPPEGTDAAYCVMPGGAKHALRNRSSEPVVQLITTTPRLGRFFLEIGRRIAPGARAIAVLASQYGYRMGSPAENAAIGITLTCA